MRSRVRRNQLFKRPQREINKTMKEAGYDDGNENSSEEEKGRDGKSNEERKERR